MAAAGTQVTPKFCKQYARVGEHINAALSEFRQDVEARRFPDDAHSPYGIDAAEVEALSRELREQGLTRAAGAAEDAFGGGKA